MIPTNSSNELSPRFPFASSRQSVAISVKPVGKNEEGGRPQSYKNSKSLRVSDLCLGGTLAAGQIPNGNGTEDRSEAEDKTKAAQCPISGGIHVR